MTATQWPMPRPDPEVRAADVLRGAGVAGVVPVPVEAVADHLGATVVLQRMDAQVSGMTYRHEDAKVIGINNGHHPRRRRFTLAHEIGHLCMHPGQLLVDSSVRVDFRTDIPSLASPVQEREANQFAAALLMPEAAVESRFRALTDAGVRGRDRLVAELASEFDVSAEAMGYRLINLGLISP